MYFPGSTIAMEKSPTSENPEAVEPRPIAVLSSPEAIVYAPIAVPTIPEEHYPHSGAISHHLGEVEYLSPL